MKNREVRLANRDIQMDSIVDGEGIRSVIWFQGCSHNCEGCHNPETHDFNSGVVVSIDELKKDIAELEYQTGVTFSGGDPMMQVEALVELAEYVHECGMNVWCYTGFTFEQLLKMGKSNELYIRALKAIDVLVDGKFEMNLKSFNIPFRGSSNQRIIDVARSLELNEVIKLEKYV